MIKDDLKYALSHEWIKADGDTGTIGITDYAQKELGDIVFVELPQTGKVLKKGEVFGVVESVKTASDLYMPVSGEITGVNDSLSDKPETLNESPYDEGWIIKIKISDPDEIDSLMSADDYKKHTGSGN